MSIYSYTTMVDGEKNLNTPWALYQLNVIVFWTLGVPVVNKFLPNIFLQKLPDFSGTNLFYSVKLPKLDSGKIGHFLKKIFGRKFINYWHPKSPENHHNELVEAPGAVKIFSMLAIDHSANSNS